MILQKSARFLMIFLCAIMFHGNVFGEVPLEFKNCHEDTHIIGYGLNPDCRPCDESKYAKLDYNSVVRYYKCQYTCSNDDYCILEGEEGKDCVKTDDVYARGADGKCVENNICASADGSCLTAGCGRGADNQCQQCGEGKNSITIPEIQTLAGTTSAHNICFSNDLIIQNITCDENGFCHCNSGYRAEEDGVSVQCVQCPSNNNYITDENNACKECPSGQVANNVDNTCDCPENQTFDETKNQCVCKPGYGLDENDENGVCKEPGDGQFVNDSGIIKNCGFGRVPKEEKNECITCDRDHVANENQTECVEKCQGQGQGYGKYTDKYGYSQCVKCTDYGRVPKPDNDNSDSYICIEECGAYQIPQQDGSCAYCSGADNIYDTGSNECISICNNEYDADNKLVKRAYSFTVQTWDNERHGVCTKCGPYDDFRYQKCKSCESNQWFDDTKNTGEHCQPCPKNFACNGKTKKRCPFGTLSAENEGVCKGLLNSNPNKGFLYNIDNTAVNKVVSESDYDNYDVERFEYSKCSNVNGYAERYADSESYKQIYGEESLAEQYNGYKNMLERDYSEYLEGNNASVDFSNIFGSSSTRRNIYVCHQCKDIERAIASDANVSGVCLCGQNNANPTAGQIVDIVTDGGHGTVCQVCPQDSVNTNNGQGVGYTCNPCSADKEGFLWNESTKTFDCATCSGNTALYTDSSNMKLKWCLTYAEFDKVVDDAGTYYQEDNVWKKCPAGSCCFGGEKYECVQGTYSWTGMACSGAAGNCVACENGKTTRDNGTVCNSTDPTTCQSSVCNTYIDAKKFCIKDKQNQNWCFEIAEIPMSFEKMYHIKNKEPEL